MLRPQSLQTLFPCSLRRRQRHENPATYPNLPTPPPPQSLQKQDHLETALLYLARAAAQLTPDSAAAGSLFAFAAVSWTLEKWQGEVEKARGGGGGGVGEGVEEEVGTREIGGAGGWVRRAVGALKREEEEGEYWRDGRDLEVLWGRVGGDCV